MRRSRIFLDTDLEPGMAINLPAPQVNYVINVLRLVKGNTLIVFNGRSWKKQKGEFNAVVESASRREAIIKIIDFTVLDIESKIHTTLLQGISRGERMDFAIQKAVELGVTEIQPVVCARTNLRIADERMQKKWQHWQSVADHACQQCGRTIRVNVNQAVAFMDLTYQENTIALMLSPDAIYTLGEKLGDTGKPVRLLIGPEGGLDEMEQHHAHKNLGFDMVRLGPRILRTETAALSALSIIQFIAGDLGER